MDSCKTTCFFLYSTCEPSPFLVVVGTMDLLKLEGNVGGFS